MYKPKISIIIPVYNGVDYLKESIDSALNQTYEDVEVIVVNDGSDDGGATEKVAKSYGDKIRYFSKPNGGVSSALNYGISQMEGDWFSWLSHDDLYMDNKLEEQMRYLNKKVLKGDSEKDISKIVLYCDTEHINDKGEVILRLKPIAKEFEPAQDIMLKNLKKNRLGGCSFLVHREAMENVGGFNESIRTVSDYELWYRLLLNGYIFYYVPKTLVQGRMHKKQVTYRMSDLGLQEFEGFHNWLLSEMDRKPEYDDWTSFYRVACYARQRGYYESSDVGFSMMKKRCSYPVYFFVKPAGMVYSDVYRVTKRMVKGVYKALFIK